MIEDQIGVQLHQKKFRGEKLTKEEHKQLNEWYAMQDNAETAKLNIVLTENTIEQLRTQISDILNQITHLTQQIQKVALDNDKIRQENTRLFQLLAQKSKAA